MKPEAYSILYIIGGIFALLVIYMAVRVTQVRVQILRQIDADERMQAELAATDNPALTDALVKLADSAPVPDRVRILNFWQLYEIGFNWHDVWVGVYWKYDQYDSFDNMPDEGEMDKLTIYICPLPCCLLAVQRVRFYQTVPRADRNLDPVCRYCNERQSTHPVTLSELEACAGKF